MRLVAVMLAAGVVAGCGVGSQAQVGMMIGSGELRAEPDPADSQRMIVTIRSHDLVAAYDQPENQQRIVTTALARQCGDPQIESRRVTQFGTTPIGMPIRTYTLTVRCPNGATSPAER